MICIYEKALHPDLISLCESGHLVVHVLDATQFSKYILDDVASEIDRLWKIRHPSILPAVCAALIYRPVRTMYLCQPKLKQCISLKRWKTEHTTQPRHTAGGAANSNPLTITHIKILLKLCRALVMLHSTGQAHGHLNSRNIVICNPPKNDPMRSPKVLPTDKQKPVNQDTSPIPIILDLGFHSLKRYVSIINNVDLRSAYSAPELLSGTCHKASPEQDVYSFGMLMWVLASGLEPFEGKTIDFISSVVDKRQRPNVPRNVGEDCSTLIRSCWQEEPAARPTSAVVEKQLEKILSKNIKT